MQDRGSGAIWAAYFARRLGGRQLICRIHLAAEVFAIVFILLLFFCADMFLRGYLVYTLTSQGAPQKETAFVEGAL
jgi:hypothetical protein